MRDFNLFYFGAPKTNLTKSEVRFKDSFNIVIIDNHYHL